MAGFASLKPALVVLIFVSSLMTPHSCVPVYGKPLRFLSTQLTPFDEASKMRNVILGDFQGEVDFQPNDDRSAFKQLMEECQKGSGKVDLIGGLHGDFSGLAKAGLLVPVDGILARLGDRRFFSDLVKLGTFGGRNQHYIPWMQATYIMVANRRALKYLPNGATLDRLSYDQLMKWAVNMKEASGEPKLGFPIDGLIHRFIQGYLYPAFTGCTLRKFRSPEAEVMWRFFRDLWSYVNPRSLNFGAMDSPLLEGAVWVAWDHTAKVAKALNHPSQDFIAFPAPVGPKGRGFMLVLAGLGLPKCSSDHTAALDMIEYLTRPAVQRRTFRSVFFFPIQPFGMKRDLSPGLVQLVEAVNGQLASDNGIKTLLPIGLEGKDRAFNTAYKLTFSQIVLRRRDIKAVLAKQRLILTRILSETRAGCWSPDEASIGPCPVE